MRSGRARRRADGKTWKGEHGVRPWLFRPVPLMRHCSIKWRRVARRMSLTIASAGAFAGPDFCFIFAPFGYDEPEILRSREPSVCLMGADGGQSRTAFG